jgi:hypothetical protein
MDMNMGPQVVADIRIADGMTDFVNGVFRNGDEFCVANPGDNLPEVLFVFVNAPMGGNTPESNQFAILNTTCAGPGLTLLNDFGAIKLVHYINDCQGNNDCFVPITYNFTVQNDGQIGLSVTEWDRTVNGEPRDLTEGKTAEELRLAPGQHLSEEEEAVADCCSNASYEISTSVVAEGDDGSVCEDNDRLNLTKPTRTTFPTMSPSKSSELPNPPPSEAPSPSPSETSPPPSSDRPSAVPSTQMPQGACFVQLSVECTPEGEAEDCNSILPLRTRCEDRPFAMVFRYNGGGCDQSFNIQPPDLFQCFDFHGGPPTIEGAVSYITVTDIRGLDIIYHADFVAVGDEYTVADNGRDVEPNMNISIWSSEDTSPENLLQTLIFHSSCSQNLFLKDRFGASQLVIFVNEEQGVVSCFVNVTYTYIIENNLVGGNAVLQTLSSTTNFGVFNLTDAINGVSVDPGTAFRFPVQVVLDLTFRQRYTAFSVVTGASPDGFVCQDTDFLEFVAGNPLPPTFPTFSPTASPSFTPLPTIQGGSCVLKPLIVCRVLNGPNRECDNIASPTQLTCLGGGLPDAMEFRYLGGTCDGNNNQIGFTCDGEADAEQVWITIISGTSVLYNQPTLKGQFLNLRGIQQQLEVSVFSILNGAADFVIQNMTINAECISANDLTLKSTFGSLEFVEFIVGQSQNAAYADVNISYRASTETGIRAIVTSAVSDGAFAGSQTLLSSASDPIGPRDELILGGEAMVVDLTVSAGTSFSFVMSLEGYTVGDPAATCPESTSFSFSV